MLHNLLLSAVNILKLFWKVIYCVKITLYEMLSSKSAKVVVVCFLIPTFISACFLRQNAAGEMPPTPFLVEELKSDVPFSAKEPEKFQAEFVVSTGGAEDKTFAARNGVRQLFTFNFGKKNQFSVLQTGDGKSITFIKDKKVYVENSGESVARAAENPFDFLTTEWLNQKADAKFEKLGAENSFMKYRAVLGERGKSEVLIWVDEKIGLPVKQEFYSVTGEQKTLTATFEIKNFSPQADDNLFEIPKDFRKITIEEFRKILHSEE